MSEKRSKSKAINKDTLTKVGVGAAIGSAAIAAALLYVNHNRKKDAAPTKPEEAEPTD